MADYPSIPISHDGFVELPRAYQVVRTGYEAGYAQTRPKTTTAPRAFSLTHHGASLAEVATWNTFWEARKGGAEAFNFTDPRTGDTIACRFRHDAGNPPPVTPIGGGKVGYNIGPIALEEAL